MSAREQVEFRADEQSTRADRLLCIEQVEERAAMGKTHIYGLIKLGKFPRQVKVGSASRWVDAEITQWIAELMAQRDAIPSKAPR